MLKIINSVPVLVVLFSLIGCANPPIVQISGDTYMLSKEDHGGIFGSSAKLKADVIREANAFAKSKGKVAVPVSVRQKPVGNSPGDWASFEYQFKLVDENNPEAKSWTLNDNRKDMPVRANYSVQHTENITADINVDSENSKNKDVYSELIKINDLRERGIITQSEFKKMKEDILSAK